MRKRRAFLINSTALLLIIPLMLLLATYEDVSSQIIVAQSERTQVERTYRVVSYFELDFQKALELSGKRAVVAAVDYVAVTGSFISPAYRVNNTIRDLILTGTSSSMPGYDFDRVMKGQSIRKWLTNMSQELREQGYELSPSVDEIADNISITVAPLDSFRVVVKARIPNVTIRDLSGRTIYTGPIPRSGGYIYSIVNLENLEDSFFSAMTGGRYQRSIRACSYPFPELIDRPIKVLSGDGKSSEPHVPGELIKHLESDKIYFGDYYPGDGARAYVLMNGSVDQTDAPIIVNTTLNGIRISPLDVFNNNDMGVLVFDGVSAGGGTSWCYPSLEYRVNITLSGGSLSNYNGYQIPIVITDSNILSKVYHNGNNASIRFVEKESCNEVPFWIEYWSNTKAIVWIKATTSMEYTMYFGSDPSYATRGDGNSVFEWFHDTEEVLQDGEKKSFDLSSLNLEGDIAIRFRSGPSKKKKQWDSGIYVETERSYWGGWVTKPQWIYFIDDTKDVQNSLEVWDEYYVWSWWWGWVSTQGTPTNDGARGDANFHTYDVVIKPQSNQQADVEFMDYGSSYIGYPTPVRDNPDGPLRHYTPPLEYLYLVNRNNDNNNDAIFKWIFIRKYVQTLPSESFSSVELKPASANVSTGTARAYDIQPFIDCIQDNRYFGVYDGWSFFERLEGSSANHEAYVALAHRMQDELGVKYGDEYYPIGLVSFMIPHANYDEKLFNLFNTLGISVEEGQSSVDYYFLNYYFKGGSKVSGFRVWGISQGVISSGDLSTIPFFLDEDTAEAIFGKQGAEDLLQR